MEISGFTFVHNAIDSGYPIIEAIDAVLFWVDNVYVVDMESTDTTCEVLEQMSRTRDIRIINGKWNNEAGKTLANAHALNKHCSGDIIIHFEADEVYPEGLLEKIVYQIDEGRYDLAVWRLQLEQNFQRCRWYPELVHRVFKKDQVWKKGHTTYQHQAKTLQDKIKPISQEYGFLWDITNCFRDNWLNRINKQAELRDEEPNYLYAPLHINGSKAMSEIQVSEFLSQAHWEWEKTPFDIPDILKPLVGVTKYSESESYRRLMR